MPGNGTESGANATALSRQRGRPALANTNENRRKARGGPPCRAGGSGKALEPTPGARRSPPATASTGRRETSKTPTFDSLLRAMGALSMAKNMHDISQILEKEIVRVLAGTDREVEVCLGQAKHARRPAQAGGQEKAACAPPGSAPTDEFAERALRRRRLAWTGRDGQIRLVIPLLSRNEPWGYVDTRVCRSGPPDEQEAAYLQSLANSAASALEIACLRRNVGSEAMTDSVTGFYSGWHFHERLLSETARARRYGQPLSAIIFEVDDFDEFVEESGQAKGAYLLRAVSRLVKGSMRHKVDLAYRCGGARFALLLPNTPCTKEGAALVAERMRNLLEVTDFRTGEDEFLGRFTMSAGVAGLPAQCDDADELAAAAEEALCEAKTAGKNKVQIYRE